MNLTLVHINRLGVKIVSLQTIMPKIIKPIDDTERRLAVEKTSFNKYLLRAYCVSLKLSWCTGELKNGRVSQKYLVPDFLECKIQRWDI